MHMSTLPTHPRTGLAAVGWRKPRRHHGEVDVQPIWPIAGAEDEPDPETGIDSADPKDSGPETGEVSLEDLAAEVRSLGLSPAQIQARLKASRQWEDRAKGKLPLDLKRLREKAEKYDELVESQKSDLEKASEKALTAEQERDAAKAEALRYRIAAKNHISDEDADLFLTGSDEDTLNKQAERYVALQGTKQTSGPVVPRSGTGDGTPNSGSVSAGRDMYKPRAKKE